MHLAILIQACSAGKRVQITEEKCQRVLWFMGLKSAEEADYSLYIKAAVLSAKEHAPSLVPVLIFQGAPNSVTAWFERHGGTVLFHSLSFLDALPETQHGGIGAYLRMDIPLLMAELPALGADVDRTHVLYTDIDVMFLGNFDSCSIPKPAILALGGQHSQMTKANTGVMYMNVTAWGEHTRKIVAFAKSRKFDFVAHDQGIILAYFDDSDIQQLPDALNWKPYWGKSKSPVVIVHFHGPKPRRGLPCILKHRTQLDKLCPDVPEAYRDIFQATPDGGSFYDVVLQKFDAYVKKAGP